MRAWVALMVCLFKEGAQLVDQLMGSLSHCHHLDIQELHWTQEPS